MKTQANSASAVGGAAHNQGADGGAGKAAGEVVGRDGGSKAAPEAQYYCIRLTRKVGEDSFEGFFNRNGKRHGKGRYTWADGTVGLGIWSDGRCDVFDDACTKYTKAERQKTKRAMAPTLERQKCDKTKKKGVKKAKRVVKYKKAESKCDKCGEAGNEITFECHKCKTAYCNDCEQKTRYEGFKKRPPCICLESFSTLERQEYWGMCVKCGEACKEFSFKCLNCEIAYCKTCEKKTREEGFKKRRPPCKCLIDAKGIAVEIQGAELDLDDWKPRSVQVRV
jgi:hypothetical protein